jgi:4-amino-4-deoxy-L-arabinose transferase-like glycosyltransferase
MHPTSRFASFTKGPVLWNIVFGLTLLVYASGLFVTIMEPDAAVYAQVSMEMHDRGDFLSIYHKGADWLDKPHFPFWMSAISYKIFGVNTFAYKLPAVIFVLIAALYTFLFARKYYSRLHGWMAALVLITAQHIIISNQDVRAEPFMTCLVIMAMYHLTAYLETFKGGMVAPRKKGFGHAVLGSLALACLIMTKGFFTIIPVGSGIGLSLIYSRDWKAIFNWRWVLVGVMTVVFLFPSLYGYYLQFDKHPEKVLFGDKNVSGVKFFLWTSQWGRFTNTGPIKGKGDLSYFVHTMLWAFLPWAFAAFYALFVKTRQLIKRQASTENFTYFGFITLFLIFSFSKFQLSFYLNPLFPFLAILTTAALLNSRPNILKTFSVIHTVLACLIVVALFFLHYFFSGTMPHIDTIIVLLVGFSLGFYIFTRRGMYLKKIFFATPLVCLAVNYYVNRDFYPGLLKYQAESEMAYFIKEQRIPPEQLVVVGDVESVGDIILHHRTPIIPYDSVSLNALAEKYVFTSPEGMAKLDSLGLKYKAMIEFEDFHVTRLTGKFINRKTRASEVKQKYLLKTGKVDFRRPVIDVAIQ